MPTIVTIGKIKIQIFINDHNPPHFHIVTPDHEILVRISDFTILAGDMDRNSLKAAIQWAKDNKGVLVNEWNKLRTK